MDESVRLFLSLGRRNDSPDLFPVDCGENGTGLAARAAVPDATGVILGLVESYPVVTGSCRAINGLRRAYPNSPLDA